MTRQMIMESYNSSSKQSSENFDHIDTPLISINGFEDLDGKMIKLREREKTFQYKKQLTDQKEPISRLSD